MASRIDVALAEQVIADLDIERLPQPIAKRRVSGSSRSRSSAGTGGAASAGRGGVSEIEARVDRPSAVTIQNALV